MADKKPAPPTKKSSPLSLKLDASLFRDIIEKVVMPIKAHHTLILFILLMSVVIYSVYNVSMIIQTPDDAEYRAEAESTSIKTIFDRATIKKIDELHQSNTDTNIELPDGRRNPFMN